MMPESQVGQIKIPRLLILFMMTMKGWHNTMIVCGQQLLALADSTLNPLVPFRIPRNLCPSTSFYNELASTRLLLV